MTTYRIIRLARGCDPKIIKTGLRLNQAQTHCKREDTHKIDKKGGVVWFDAYITEGGY